MRLGKAGMDFEGSLYEGDGTFMVAALVFQHTGNVQGVEMGRVLVQNLLQAFARHIQPSLAERVRGFIEQLIYGRGGLTQVDLLLWTRES